MIGVCINYYNNNFGGLLQALATTKILEDRNLQYELIQYHRNWSFSRVIKTLPRLFNNVLFNDQYELLKMKIGTVFNSSFNSNNDIRTKAFSQFKKKAFTNFSPVYNSYNELCSGAEKYARVLTGSDQLWTPAGLPTNYYNLMFVPDHIPKISYASSFGVSQIPWYQKKRTEEYLNRFQYISMRENRGAEIVKELTGKDVPTVLDPVMMFDQNGWTKLVPFKPVFDEPYIFAYLLGSDITHRKAINDLSKETGLKIVMLRHLDQYINSDEGFGHFAPYDIAPDQFLNLVRGASYVCTDSYHGSCFSIIHEKKFLIFNRYHNSCKHSKNSRIDTLCKYLNIENRRYNSNCFKEINTPINYDYVSEKITLLREEANKYLNMALSESFYGIYDTNRQ